MNFRRFLALLYTPGALLVLLLATSSAFGADTNVVFLADGHIDIRIEHTPENETNRLSIVVEDDNNGGSYASNEVVLVVKESARLTLPAGTPFGNEGEDLWVLPQSQDPELLYIGFSAEGVPLGVFDSALELFLKSVEGPGAFYAWQATGIGMLDVKMDSADGISDADKTTLIVGGHQHMNFGFSTSGVYRITFQASGQQVGESTNSLSAETTVTFHVLPLPPETETPFAKWQVKHWPSETPDSTKGPMADPDGDGIINLLEYAFGFDPKAVSNDGLPAAQILTENGRQYGALSFRRNKAATDLVFTVQVSSSLTDETWLDLTSAPRIEDRGETELVTVRDAVALDAAPMRFYRLAISFKP